MAVSICLSTVLDKLKRVKGQRKPRSGSHPSGGWSAGEIEVRLVFEENDKHTYEAVGVSAKPGEPPVLFSYVFDSQRAETGYEGGRRTNTGAGESAVEDFIRVVRTVLGEPPS